MTPTATKDLFVVPLNTAEGDDLAYWQSVRAKELSTSPYLRNYDMLAHARKMIKQLKEDQ